MINTPSLTYGSVCSGIEAATCAWEPLGWQASWVAEIEAFPSAVLAQRLPDVPNLGDMTTIAPKVTSGEIAAPDVLVGGTPCQAYSIAGNRHGLKDPRGLLTLKYIELANAIDEKRRESGKPPAVIVWENVPGVLSMSDNAFGHFIAGLAGADEAIEPGYRPEQRKSNPFWRWNEKTDSHIPKWTGAGYVTGPQRKVAWRILDAQYFGVAQRRRRVFVVAGSGDGFDPEKILIEFDGVRRDSKPRRTPGTAVAALTASGVGVRGADDNQAQAGHLITTFDRQSSGEYGTEPVASTVTASDYKRPTDLIVSVHGTQDPDVLEQMAHTIGCNQGQENAVFSFAKPCEFYVRRLTPVECERLQGFPDGWAQIPWRNKATEECPDGLRYKAIGNSMAVPVMRWIGSRIAQQFRAVNTTKPSVKTLVPAEKKRVPAQEIKMRKTRPVERQPETGVVDDPYKKPFLKWAGGKFKQLGDILPLLQGHQRIIEPFAGGGSVFMNAGLKTALINDNCSDLINTYQQLQKEAHSVITKAYRLFEQKNTAEAYLSIREKFNAGRYTPLERAAVFIYLNRHCFNGLMRYNQKGHFNVSYGKYDKPYFPAVELEEFIGCSEGMTFTCGDYSNAVNQAGAGDVLFCDPPYEPLPGKDGFTQYSNSGAFTFADQTTLAKLAVQAHQRGATVVITNSGAESVRELYSRLGFTVHDVSVARSMSSRSGTRKLARDIIAVLRGSH